MFDYDKFFNESPLEIHDQPERHQKIAELCRGSVLDIGCGTGSLTEYYKGEYTGLDVSEVAIKKAREHRNSDCSFFVEDCTKIKADYIEKADTIVMAEFLEHIDNDEHIFKTISERQFPGGHLIVSVPNGERIPSPDHVRTFTAKQLRDKLRPLGDVRIIKWVGMRERLIATVDLKKIQRNIITLSVIAKDEEKGIEECLLSALECTDKIIVQVDDSTTDKTAEIAKRYADQVIMYKWQNDFSAARNNLLMNVKTPWVLFLDGHEFLVTPPNIHTLGGTEDEGRMCQIRIESGTIVRYPRLHRSFVRYKDAVHNQLDTRKVSNDPEILIQHDRTNLQTKMSTKNREKQRHEMITKIMGEKLRKDPTDTRALMHMGLHFHARKNYKRAAKFYKKYLKYGTVQGETWYVTFNLIMCYLSVKAFWRAEHIALKLEDISPDRWENEQVLGLIYKLQNQLDRAILHYTNSLEEKKHEADYKPIQRDPSHTWNEIGECYFNLGKFAEASQAFRMAAKRCKIDEFKTMLYARSKLMAKMAVAQQTQKQK